MDAKQVKKLRRWQRRRWRTEFKDYVKMMQEQPLRERLYFAWFIVAKRGAR